MKKLIRMMTVVAGLSVWHAFAFADMPEPKTKADNPYVVAGRKAIEAKDFKSAVGVLTQAGFV